MLERLAFEKFHGNERAALKLADIVNGAAVGMIQRGGGARFAAESFDGLIVVGDVVRKEFKSDVAAEARVFGFVHYAHTTAAKFFENGVMGDGAAEQRGSIGHQGMEFNAEDGKGQLRPDCGCTNGVKRKE